MQRTFSKSGIYSNRVVMYKPVGNGQVVLGEPLNEVLIPLSLSARWRDFAAGLVGAVSLQPHVHEGRCVGNRKCLFYVNGIDCPASCTFPKCGNTFYRDGITSIQVEEIEENGTVRAYQNVKQGTQVGEYGGVLVDIEEFQVIAKKAREGSYGVFSAVDYGRGGGFVVVARDSGNWTRFLRHSCKPNLSCILRMGSNLMPVVRVVALRDIDAGETLTLDFRSQTCNRGFSFRCDCGQHNSGDANGGTRKPEEVEGIADVKSGLRGHRKEVTETGALVDTEKAAFDVEREEGECGDSDDEDMMVGNSTSGAATWDEGKGPDAGPTGCGGRVAQREEGECSDSEEEEVPGSLMLAAIERNKNLESLKKEYPGAGASKGIDTMPGSEFARRGLISQRNDVGPPMEAGSVREVTADESGGPPVVAAGGSVVRIRYFTCEKCKKDFGRRSNLVRHELTHEKGRFECSECKAVLSTKESLKRHAKRHDRDEGCVDGRKFVCAECGKGYRENSHLTRHMLKHGDEWEFGCSLCDKRFYRKDALKRHVLKRHKLEVESGIGSRRQEVHATG